ncbi:histidinol dehydrogenase [Pullulanibacillus camelliae]|uniref:Histidinol dehydrogenase n=1 Tax=Pullulanibacillus camelliae TaxID=1707096 RepID=A0A8J2VSC5_9BACL|nr:histidinol dehydrogenase [Pullulanibacillus camelliae]GGE39894.1 histidinol dehydrogenase [Pullulanibacillus camelliae]
MFLQIYDRKTFTERYLQVSRSNKMDPDILATAEVIIQDIQKNGQQALEKYMRELDGGLPEQWTVTDAEKEKAWQSVSPEIIAALKKAAENITSFHQKQLQQSRMMTATESIMSGQLFRPLERVGLYVPGGTASYPSTVLMNAIPAKIAGVEEIVMTSPARNGETIAPVLCVAADIAGIQTIYKIGGIQAIAALAYGTEKIRPVNKIVGPGNAYVAAAKKLVYGDVGIDMIAGPSEVAIIADDTAEARCVAADLIAQAEHDQRSRVFLFTTSQSLIEATQKELEKQLQTLPRQVIAKASLLEHAALVLVTSIDTAFELANALAPEHLEIQCQEPLQLLGKVQNAGSVFLGHYTPEPLGDYFAGPNHVLPTQGNAAFASGLSVDDFVKKTTFLYYSKEALEQAAPYIETIATEEQLEGHARAVRMRFLDR